MPRKAYVGEERKAPEKDIVSEMVGPHKPASKKVKGADWCDFVAKGRCTIEGVLVEGEQTITLPPAAAYRNRKNRNLELKSGTIPEMSGDVLPDPGPHASAKEREEFHKQEEEFIETLEDGDPRLGAAPESFRLVKQ